VLLGLIPGIRATAIYPRSGTVASSVAVVEPDEFVDGTEIEKAGLTVLLELYRKLQSVDLDAPDRVDFLVKV